MDRVLEYEIPSEYDGANITTVLKQHFKISTNLIKDLKKYKEGIQVNGEHKRVVDLVAKGDILKITIRDTVSENIVPTDIPLDIVYEDEDVLVINKPSNMPPVNGKLRKFACKRCDVLLQKQGRGKSFSCGKPS